MRTDPTPTASVRSATEPPKNTTSGFSSPPHSRQPTTAKSATRSASSSASPSGWISRSRLQPARVGVDQARVHLVPGLAAPAAQARDVGERAVQLDDAPAARALVQAIDVLRDHARERGPPPPAPRARGGAAFGSAPENRAQPSVARAQ